MNQNLQAMLDYHQQVRHYPGALVHVETDGKVLARQVSGTLLAYEGQPHGEPMHEQAHFRIASLTKGMASLVALRLVDQGLLELDAPLAGVLPELAEVRHLDGSSPQTAPTLRHLLSHTAGFGNLGEMCDPAIRARASAVGIDGELANFSREQFLQALAKRPLTAEPGTLFQYGFCTDVVGQMIERVTNQSLQAAMQRLLFEPLGMTQTSFRIDPHSHAQMPRAFAQDAAWHNFVKGFEAADRRAHELGLAGDSMQGPIHSAGGGLVSTLDDISRYARLIANGGIARNGKTSERLISEATFAAAMSNQLGPRTPGPYNFTGGGFGFGLAGAIRNDWAPAAIPAAPGEFTWSGVTGHTLFVAPGKGWFALMLSSNTASRVIVRLEFRRAVAGL